MSDIMKGKKGLIMGVANDHSIAWGIAKTLHAQGAEMAFTYQGDAFGKRVKPLAESIGADKVWECDVSDENSLDKLFDTIEKEWGEIDFLVHAIAFSDKEELKGDYVNTSLDNFLHSMQHWKRQSAIWRSIWARKVSVLIQSRQDPCVHWRVP